MRDKPHATFLEHGCIPSKTKVKLFTARKNFNVEISAIEVGLQCGILSKTAHFHLNILILNALNMLSALQLAYLMCWAMSD